MSDQNKTNKAIAVSAIQQQFWLLNQIHPNNSAYNIPSVFRISGQLNIKILEQSINKIIERHEIFRTYFSVVKDELLQHVVPQFSITIQVDKHPDILEEDNANRIIVNEVIKPFKLAELPLLRVRIIQLPDKKHLLLITMHHVITDLRTKDLFAKELEAFYNAGINNKPVEFTKPETQYSDYSKWQAKWFKSDEYISMIAFWEKQFDGQSGVLDLPREKNRPSMLALNGKILTVDLDSQLTAELKLYSRKNNVTIYLTLLAAYYTLLFRYSGQKELTVGVPLTNRRKDEYKNTMGCFVNVLPLMLNLSISMSFKELLREVRLAMLGVHRNQETPFVSIVDHIKEKKDTSYNPIFQAGFTFEHPMNLSLKGIGIEPVYVHSGGAQLDIFATFWETDKTVNGVFEYNTDLFNDSFINRLSESYILILRGILSDSEQKISQIPFLPEYEREKILQEWNSTETKQSDFSCIHELFEKQVTKTPKAVAVQFQDISLNYGELSQKANQLAFYLHTKGVNAGDFIGIYMDRSLDMLVALLGILKAGGAYIPIDPNFPEERIKYMINHSRVSMLLTQERLKKSLPEQSIKISIDSDWNLIAGESKDNPHINISPDNLAYIIYTSGSTGNPKGVKVQHGAVVNFLNSMANSPGMNEQDAILAVTTLSFDIAVLELFLPLIVGAKTVIVPLEVSSDGSRLLDAISNYGITVLQATPITWRLLILAGWKGERPLNVLCGGEAMPPDLAGELVERSKNVWNMYGPTETTVWSTCSPVTRVNGSVSVGKPIANTQTYILDEFMQPVPIGVSGNLYIGGSGVTHGYLNQPALTKQKFVPNPFINDSKGMLYDTGDDAKYKNDGNIEILGRSDFQLKVRGFRVEPGEIETALVNHKNISQSVVCIHKFDNEDSRLIAYYTQTNDSNINVSELRNHLSGKLPEYMIPSIFIHIESIPLTPNGKVDRKKLPEPEKKRPKLKQKFISPQNEIEKTLCAIWCKVLKIKSVGIDDRFFEIGGTSLLGVQVINQIQSELNNDVSVLYFYQYPTVRSFVRFLQSEKKIPLEQNKIKNRATLRKKSLMQTKGRASKHRQ